MTHLDLRGLRSKWDGAQHGAEEKQQNKESRVTQLHFMENRNQQRESEQTLVTVSKPELVITDAVKIGDWENVEERTV